MPKLFISYRREDSLDISGRIFDSLAHKFGDETVFIDVDSIPFGVDFRQYLSAWVGGCDALIAVVGKGWLEATHASGPNKGKRRLEDPVDFVRIEVGAALARGIPVVPVLVSGATMPSPDRLPPDLTDFAYRNAAEVRSGRDFRSDMKRLLDNLERLLAAPAPKPAEESQPTTARESGSPQPRSAPRPSGHRLDSDPSVVEPPAVAWPTNLSFDGPEHLGMPYGWFDSVGFVGGVADSYETSVLPRDDDPHSRCARLHRTGARPREFGSLMQRCPAPSFIGKVVRFEGELRTEDLDAWAGLWLRIDGTSRHLFFDNMNDRPIRGSTPWKQYAIETRVPEGSQWLNYGLLLVANGSLWADNLALNARNADDAAHPRKSSDKA